MSLRQRALVLCLLAFLRVAYTQKCELPATVGTKFPANFKFGTASAAHQIEGAWNEDGKGPSIWDDFSHQHPELISNHDNADVSADSYHRFEQDLAALKELKVNFYRFSMSWPRILPNGDVTLRNQKGIDYYNMIINKLLENNIEPLVTMYHFDMPADLLKYGGFTNQIMIKYFRAYADILFKEFGDRVKTWLTFNEPWHTCVPAYGVPFFPPMVNGTGIGEYLCMDTLLKSHAAVYELYRSKYVNKQGGRIGIALSGSYWYSKENRTDLVERAAQYMIGWQGNAIFHEQGNYPKIMLDDIAANSRKEGRAWTRLEPIKGDWLKLLQGSADFMALNYYTSRYVETGSDMNGTSWYSDMNLKTEHDPNWELATSEWLYCVPSGLEDLLVWIRDNYNNVEVIITENGWSDEGRLNDPDRIVYLKAHLQAVLNAINKGCNVAGYTYWSLIDNFEWRMGYTEKFGLYYVNMTSDNKERYAKDSSHYYRRVIESRDIHEADPLKLE